MATFTNGKNDEIRRRAARCLMTQDQVNELREKESIDMAAEYFLRFVPYMLAVEQPEYFTVAGSEVIGPKLWDSRRKK